MVLIFPSRLSQGVSSLLTSPWIYDPLLQVNVSLLSWFFHIFFLCCTHLFTFSILRRQLRFFPCTVKSLFAFVKKRQVNICDSQFSVCIDRWPICEICSLSYFWRSVCVCDSNRNLRNFWKFWKIEQRNPKRIGRRLCEALFTDCVKRVTCNFGGECLTFENLCVSLSVTQSQSEKFLKIFKNRTRETLKRIGRRPSQLKIIYEFSNFSKSSRREGETSFSQRERERVEIFLKFDIVVSDIQSSS